MINHRSIIVWVYQKLIIYPLRKNILRNIHYSLLITRHSLFVIFIYFPVALYFSTNAFISLTIFGLPIEIVAL